ncbi:MAG: hypothetical protein OEW05_00060 [Candidatus Aminicenantes bacterium]|nr:hypothetical protein [Candidatus Aminicenantes bacterium]
MWKKISKAAALALAVTALGTAGNPQGANNHLPRPRPGADIFALMEALKPYEARAVWPGFVPATIPVAVFDGTNTYVFGLPSAPEGFSLVPGRSGVYVYPGQHVLVRSNRRIQLAGIWVASITTTQPFETFVGNVIHEKFHVLQAHRHPDWRPNDAFLFFYPLDTPEAVLARRLEVEAFKRAVTAADEADARGWAAEGLRYRRRRLANLKKGLANYEDEVQRLEGLAEYVEWKTLDKDVLDRIYDLDFAPGAIRSYGYTAGRWFGYLLNRFDAAWKEDLETGAFQYLRERLEKSVQGAPSRGFGSYELAETKKSVDRDFRSRQESLKSRRQDFDARPGWRVEVLADRDPLRLRLFLANRAVVPAEREMIHERWLTLFNDACDLEVVNRECLTVSNGVALVLRVVIPGLDEKPAVRHEDGKDLIRVPGVVLRFTGAEVTEAERTLIVRLAEPATIKEEP